MFLFTITMHIVTFLFVFVFSGSYGQDRKIFSEINPGCKSCTNKTTLVYIKATGSHDVIHQIWDFTRHLPTMIFTHGLINSTLNITWDGHNKPEQFKLNERAKYCFAAVIDKLIEYDDYTDKGRLDPLDLQKEYDFKNVVWKRENGTTVLSDREAKIVMNGRFTDSSHPKASISMKLDFIPFQDSAVDLPHLIHTANSSLVDVSLVNLTTRFNSSRFALHLVLVGTDGWREDMTYSMPKSLDDEHTPGVFEIVEIRTPESLRGGDGGFIQYRPVAYTQPERAVTTSTNVYISDLNHTEIRVNSTVDLFFADYFPLELLVEDTYISFGETGDGCYRHHNYTAWSFTIGYGSPPVEGFSLFVIVLICVGLGLPVALAMSGVAHVLVRRRRARNNPQRLIDED